MMTLYLMKLYEIPRVVGGVAVVKQVSFGCIYILVARGCLVISIQ